MAIPSKIWLDAQRCEYYKFMNKFFVLIMNTRAQHVTFIRAIKALPERF